MLCIQFPCVSFCCILLVWYMPCTCICTWALKALHLCRTQTGLRAMYIYIYIYMLHIFSNPCSLGPSPLMCNERRKTQKYKQGRPGPGRNNHVMVDAWGSDGLSHAASQCKARAQDYFDHRYSLTTSFCITHRTFGTPPGIHHHMISVRRLSHFVPTHAHSGKGLEPMLIEPSMPTYIHVSI